MNTQKKPKWRTHNGSQFVPKDYKQFGGILYRNGTYVDARKVGSFGSVGALWTRFTDDERSPDIVAYELKEDV